MTRHSHEIEVSSQLKHVRYEIRGPLARRANELERQGHEVLKLNIGNPAPFGFEAPEAIVEGNRQKAAAQAEILAATGRAREDLRKQVSMLAVAGAEKLIRREIDSRAHKALLDELAAEI